ncbi:MAG: glycerol-3-phosphate 1-O-acyltransferase PlsY [Dehalococcoidia bacterium]|nr:glycerol-3-phosphate 1-O-acyltransferase PlsY [Dehalococcoidia bacterium]
MIGVRLAGVIIIAYLIGSIPFGLIICKLKAGVDVRKYGSGKTGATNVMRVAGTKFGILTIILDGAKAAGAVMLVGLIMRDEFLAMGSISFQQIVQVTAGLAAVAGHNWPVFAKFKGGRGVTAYFGTLIAIYPPVAIFGIEILTISALRSRRMSQSSMLAVLAVWCLMVPLTLINDFSRIYLAYGLAGIALIVYQHRDNVKRLRQGTERQLW